MNDEEKQILTDILASERKSLDIMMLKLISAYSHELEVAAKMKKFDPDVNNEEIIDILISELHKSVDIMGKFCKDYFAYHS